MKLSLQQSEIEAAIRADISAQGIAIQGKQITFDFTMGRKGTGLSVDVNILARGEAVKIAEDVLTAPATAAVIVEQAQTDVASEPDVATGYSTNVSTSGSLFANGG